VNKEHEFLVNIVKKFENGTMNWADARHFLEISDINELDWFFNQIGKIRDHQKNEPKSIKIFTPGKHFPALSFTGTTCELNCEHCDKKYLNHMIDASSEEKFQENLNKIVENDGIGALFSGGSLKSGKVPILKYSRLIEKFKANNKFHINAHVGLVDFSDAMKLKEIGIDTVSFDMVLDRVVIEDVFHLDADIEDFMASYTNLCEAEIRVVPHLLIGARFGQISRELDVLKILKYGSPELIVFIVMIPPKEALISGQFHMINPIDVAKFFFIAKCFYPKAELSLGCMRPRNKNSFDLEHWAILAGANRIEIPSKKTLNWLEKEEYEIKYFGACCAVPNEFLQYAKANDIKGELTNKDLIHKKKI
jgi:lipoyl synthase